jgi:hypothetical protein
MGMGCLKWADVVLLGILLRNRLPAVFYEIQKCSEGKDHIIVKEKTEKYQKFEYFHRFIILLFELII